MQIPIDDQKALIVLDSQQTEILISSIENIAITASGMRSDRYDVQQIQRDLVSELKNITYALNSISKSLDHMNHPKWTNLQYPPLNLCSVSGVEARAI